MKKPRRTQRLAALAACSTVLLSCAACTSQTESTVSYGTTEDTASASAIVLKKHHFAVVGAIDVADGDLIRGLETTHEGHILASLAPVDPQGDNQSSAGKVITVDVDASSVVGGFGEQPTRSTVVRYIAQPDGYAGYLTGDKKDAVLTRQLDSGWSVTQLLGFDETTKQIYKSTDVWATAGAVEATGFSLRDDDTKDSDKKGVATEDTIPLFGTVVASNVCALPLIDPGKQKQGVTDKTKSSLGTASVLATDGSPLMTVLNPVTMQPVGYVGVRIDKNTRDVDMVDVGSAASTGTLQSSAAPSAHPVDAPLPDPAGMVSTMAHVPGITETECLSTRASDSFGFGGSSHPVVLGVYRPELVDDFTRGVADAGVITSESELMARFGDDIAALGVDSSSGVVTDAVIVDKTDKAPEIQGKVMRSVAAVTDGDKHYLWTTFDDSSKIYLLEKVTQTID